MKERFKTVLLAGLILLSLYLTYILWFGSPHLEEGVLPRYEFAYFTTPPPPYALLMPATIVLQQEEEEGRHLLRRGEAEHARVWHTAYELLKRRLPGSVGERPDETELTALLDDALFKLLFRFNPPLPESFLWDRVGSPAELHAITLFASGANYYILLDGSEKVLYRWIDWGESALNNLVASIDTNSGTITEKLPAHFVLQAIYPDDGTGTVIEIITERSDPEEKTEDNLDNTGMDDELLSETEEGENTTTDEPTAENGAEYREGDLSPADNVSPQSEEELDEEESIPRIDQWEIAVRGHIYVPNAATAIELALTREELPEKELVSAFFIDPTMARRIEERDGAIYYTDGKKGLRLYAVGTVEYTAPGLDVFNNRLSYSAALLEAAKNQSLYGGWPHGVFLERREKSAGGYRFFWRSYAAGFPLITDESSCEMLVNDKGMPYYRRSFYTIIEKTGEKHPYAHFKEVIYKSINLHPESFPLQEATLLSLEPVYRVIPVQTGIRAVPAWSVHFAETGRFYLHWQTLELL